MLPTFKTALIAYFLEIIPVEKRDHLLSLLLSSLGIGNTNLEKEARAFYTLMGDIHSTDVVIDIGAFRGGWSLELRRLIGPNAMIHLYEPLTPLVNYLEGCNELRPNKVFNFAVVPSHDVNNHSFIYFHENSLNSASLINESQEQLCQVVQTKSLTEILDISPHCVGLKLDIEGMEFEVLSSAQHKIMKSNVRCIQFEFGEKTILLRQNFKDFYDLFKALDFRLFRAAGSQLVSIEHYSRSHEIHLNTVFFAQRK